MKMLPDRSLLEIVESVAKIFAVGVAIWGVWQYFHEIERKRIEETYSYLDEFFTGEVANARLRLEEKLKKSEDEFLKRASESDGNEKQGVEHIFESLAQGESRVDSLLILGFFDRLQSCLAIGSCDEATAKELFSDTAQYFSGVLRYQISIEQNENKKFGFGLERIAGL